MQSNVLLLRVLLPESMSDSLSRNGHLFRRTEIKPKASQGLATDHFSMQRKAAVRDLMTCRLSLEALFLLTGVRVGT